MATRSVWTLHHLQEHTGLGRWFRSAFSVFLALAITPVLLFSYVVVSICRTLWCSLLERLFPGVEPDRSPSVRAATDTRRNQGVVTLLLHVCGRCDIEHIRRRMQEDVLERRNEHGELCFPRLRAALTSRWGHYAWRSCEPHEFHLDSHIVMGTQHFRGRPVSDANIQDYMSNIVSKFLPAELPPWQLVLVPLSGTPSSEPRFYVLIRLHHLLVDEVTALHSLLQGEWGWGGPLVPRLHAIPYFINQVLGWLRNVWTYIRFRYDPTLNSKSQRGLVAIMIVFLYVVLDAMENLYYNGHWFHMREWIHALKQELKRRRIDGKWIVSELVYVLTPTRFTAELLYLMSSMCVVALQLPLLVLRLCRSRNTLLLATDIVGEIALWCRVALDGPRLVIGELGRSLTSPPPPPVSLCGRRVVSWSEPAPVQLVERIAEAAGVAPVEVLLAAACGALREHYRRQGCEMPTVPVQPLGSSGVMLLPPEAAIGIENEPLAALQAVHARVMASRHQPSLLLASAWLRHHLARLLPSLSVRLLLNCITRRYAAIIMTAAPNILQRGPTCLWGYTIDNVLIWRPPQSNISVSLTLVRLGSFVRLAVMADQQLWPHHAALPTSFLAHLRSVANALQVSRVPRLTMTSSPCPETSASISSDEHQEASPELLRIEEERLVD